MVTAGLFEVGRDFFHCRGEIGGHCHPYLISF
jgi:hypothetical protein